MAHKAVQLKTAAIALPVPIYMYKPGCVCSVDDFKQIEYYLCAIIDFKICNTNMPSPTNKSCPVSKTYSNRTFRHSCKQRYHTARFKLVIIVKSLIVAWEQANLCKFEEAELPA